MPLSVPGGRDLAVDLQADPATGRLTAERRIEQRRLSGQPQNRVVDPVPRQVLQRNPGDLVRLIRRDRPGRALRVEGEADVVVEVGRLGSTGGNLVNVDVVDARGRRDDVLETGLLAGLTQGYAA